MESILPLIIQLVSGAAGGNLAGSLMKNLSLGTLGNSIAGILGGGLGGQLLGMLGMAGGAEQQTGLQDECHNDASLLHVIVLKFVIVPINEFHDANY